MLRAISHLADSNRRKLHRVEGIEFSRHVPQERLGGTNPLGCGGRTNAVYFMREIEMQKQSV